MKNDHELRYLETEFKRYFHGDADERPPITAAHHPNETITVTVAWANDLTHVWVMAVGSDDDYYDFTCAACPGAHITVPFMAD